MLVLSPNPPDDISLQTSMTSSLLASRSSSNTQSGSAPACSSRSSSVAIEGTSSMAGGAVDGVPG
eukprot:12416241-Karenia_brevis.AAC.1